VNDKARFIKKRKHARDKALQALYQWQLSGEDLDWIRDHYLQEQGVASGDEEYFLELLYQIPPQAEALDARYRNYVTNFEDHLDPIETNILRIATYELAINLAKTYGADDSHKFVNGVLDPLCLELRKTETGS
jgi:N utilization substance protein B